MFVFRGKDGAGGKCEKVLRMRDAIADWRA